jgi:phosphoribosylglycinamide formyltransferase 1
MKRIVIFASGAGSNAANLIRFFSSSDLAKVVAVFCNKAGAGVVETSRMMGVPCILFDRQMMESGALLGAVSQLSPGLIVLAGFLWRMPDEIIEAYPNKIINIHPALLPAFGGKGMYGMNVHRAVKESGASETGITIHYVDGHYDKGDVIFQARVSLDGSETPEQISGKVQELEHRHFAEVVESLLK